MLRKSEKRQVLFSKPCDIPAKSLQRLIAVLRPIKRKRGYWTDGKRVDKRLNRCSKRLAEGEGRAGWEGGGVGVGAYSRLGAYQLFLSLGWALIRGGR